MKRLIPILLVVAALAGAIAYSKYRPTPDRVSGFIEADEIRLGSRVGGRVREVLVEEGSTVKQGDKLIVLEPFDLIADEQQAKATLASLEAEYQRLKAGLRPEEVSQAEAHYKELQATLDELVAGPRKQEIDVAEAQLTVAQAQLKLATENFRRISAAARTNATTQENVDQATQALDGAQGAVAAREQELSLLKAGTREESIRAQTAKVEEARLAWELAKKGYREEDISKAAAARDAAQAALDAIHTRIEELVIRAPVTGTIEALELQPGDLAPPAAPVMSVIDNSRIWVRAYVPENRLELKLGQKMWVMVDSFPNKKFAGELTFIARQAEFTPSNVQTPEERVKQVFRIKVELREGLDQLRPGMAADVLLTGDGS